METVDRRSLLATGGLALAGTVAASRIAEAQSGGAKPIFDVPAVTIPIAGEKEVFPVRRIYCIGRNYAAHAIERGSDPTREPPFFFQKPTDAIQYVAPGTVMDHPYPSLTKNYHHEVELVAALKSGGANIPAEKALDIDSSLAARKELAKELHYTGDTNDSATMNMWLHKQMMAQLAANGGKLPADVKW